MSLRHVKKKISLILPKFGRTVKRDIFQMCPKMTREEREVSSMIRNLLNNPENRVVYSVIGKSIRIQTKDKKYVIALTSKQVRINFVTISINERIGNALVEKVVNRIESDIDMMDEEVISDQKEFLVGMNEVFVKNNTDFMKRSEIIKNASGKNLEGTLSKILKNSLAE